MFANKIGWRQLPVLKLFESVPFRPVVLLVFLQEVTIELHLRLLFLIDPRYFSWLPRGWRSISGFLRNIIFKFTSKKLMPYQSYSP